MPDPATHPGQEVHHARHPQTDDHTRTLGLIVGTVGLGWTLVWTNGTLSYLAMLRFCATLAALLLALFLRPISFVERHGGRILPVALLLGFGYQVAESFANEPADAFWREGSTAPILPFFHGGSLLAWALVGVIAMSSRPRAIATAFPLVLALYAVLGVWVIRHAPNPFIDVDIFQRAALDELLAGRNPYAASMTFRNIYNDDRTPFYGAGLSHGGRLQFGFIYPPLSLLLGLPGHLIGDHRYALLAATTGAAALLGYAQAGRVAKLTAALLLFMPRSFYVLEHAWTEPYVALALASVTFALLRAPGALPYALGFLLSIKQYTLLLLPLLGLAAWSKGTWSAWLAWPPPRALLRGAAITLGLLAAVNLPFVLWDVRGFFRGVVWLQFAQPFRYDALSFPALLAKLAGPSLPSLVALAGALGGAMVGWRRAPRTTSGFLTTIALTLLGFFAFNKQAFCNYYYLAFAALCCAVAASVTPMLKDRLSTP